MNGHSPLTLRNLAAEGPSLSRSAFHKAGFLREPCVSRNLIIWVGAVGAMWRLAASLRSNAPDRKYVRTDHGAGRIPNRPYDTRRSGPLPTALTRVRKGIDRAIPPHIHSLTLAGRTNG
jgi:hypothetical protein